MGEALIRAGLKRIAREVLNYPPAMKRSSAPHDNGASSRKWPRTEPPCWSQNSKGSSSFCGNNETGVNYGQTEFSDLADMIQKIVEHCFLNEREAAVIY